MPDPDYTKAYNSAERSVPEHPEHDPSPREKELLLLKAQAEKAQGKERAEIEEKIRQLTEEP